MNRLLFSELFKIALLSLSLTVAVSATAQKKSAGRRLSKVAAQKKSANRSLSIPVGEQSKESAQTKSELPVRPILEAAEGLYDDQNLNTLGLGKLPSTRTTTIFRPTDATDHYSNGCAIAAWRDKLYVMWQSSPTDEDTPDTRTLYAISHDDGQTWSAPMELSPKDPKGYYTTAGWIATEDSLVAMLAYWPHKEDPRGGYTYYSSSRNGIYWKAPRAVTMADGRIIDGVIEQDYRQLPSGRWISAAHFLPGLHLCPIYTDDPSGLRGWQRGSFVAQDRGAQSRELEPSLYVRPDGSVVMTMRDQSSSFRILASESLDEGQTWSAVEKTNMPEARQKQCAGRIDSLVYIVNCPVSEKLRMPLTLSISSDGRVFDRAFLLRSRSERQPMRYPGKAKRDGYSYPKAMARDGKIYVVYATNKEDVELTVIDLKQMMP